MTASDTWQTVQAQLSPYEATCVAVSKQQPIEAMQGLYDLGQRHFGENQCQDALKKMAVWAPKDVVWHFIGRIQSNKCKVVAQHFDWVQSVQSTKVIALLAKHRPSDDPPLNVLLQVTTNQIAHDYAVPLQEIGPLVTALQALPNLCLRGWMAMPPPTVQGVEREHFFMEVAEAFHTQKSQNHWDTLSMGMSLDHQQALAAGANMVRLGKMLFGPRS